MGSFKPLLPVGAKTMVEQVMDLFKRFDMADIIVVTGHNRDALEPVVESCGCRSVFNPDFESGMLSSVQKGVQSIRPGCGGFFVLPVDIPAVRPSTIDGMIRSFAQAGDEIIIPFFEENPGHPPLIPFSLTHDILCLPAGSGLRDLLLGVEHPMQPLNVHDRGILMDADTPAGYEQVCRKCTNLNIPDKEECLSIVDAVLLRDDPIRRHLADVSFTALKLANALSEPLNTDLVVAAGLLHDIKRKEKNHAAVGAELIRGLGFDAVSKIVSRHMDIDLDMTQPIREKEVVYFADKLCNGHGPDLNYHKRFADCVKKSPWAMTSISRRYEHTRLIQTRIESSAGKSVKEILSL